MRDEMDGRLWDHHGKQFLADLGKLFAALKAAYSKAAEIRFKAPWRPGETHNR